MDHNIVPIHIKELLKGDVLNILGEEVYYRLCQIDTDDTFAYAISIASGEECCTCCFGDDLPEALEIYEKIVRNTVTPCSLKDIAEDFAKQKQ